MPKTHPTRRNCRAKASEGPTDDQTMSALGVPERPRRQRHCRPTTRTPTLQALQRLGRNQPGWTSSWTSWTPGSKQRSKRPGTHGKLRSPHQSAGSPPPEGRGTGSAGVHAGFRLGFHDRSRSLMLIYLILHTNIEPGSPQKRPSPGKKIKRKRWSGRIPVSSPHQLGQHGWKHG